MDDEFDDFDDFDDGINLEPTSELAESFDEGSQQEDISNNSEDDIISSLLKARGIEDSSKIKMENDEGVIEEVDWNTLNNEDKLNILTSEFESDNDLDDDEIMLINSIRNSKMSPAEYVNYIQRQGVNAYLQNATIPQYLIDELTDEALYKFDILAKLGEENVTDEQLESMYNAATADADIFNKQIAALRNEYHQIEDSNRYQEQLMAQQDQIEKYNRFAESVENEIRNFKDFHGYELNMSEDEMEEVYDFITGFDKAGVSIFGKALNDPAILVRMAWYALNGEKAIRDINDYWTNEIKKISKNNKTNPLSKVEIRKTQSDSHNDTFDLDDF